MSSYSDERLREMLDALGDDEWSGYSRSWTGKVKDVRSILTELLTLRHQSSSTTRSDREQRAALQWYAEQVEGCRKITSEGGAARNALDRDGGKRARDALAALNPIPTPSDGDTPS